MREKRRTIGSAEVASRDGACVAAAANAAGVRTVAAGDAALGGIFLLLWLKKAVTKPRKQMKVEILESRKKEHKMCCESSRTDRPLARILLQVRK